MPTHILVFNLVEKKVFHLASPLSLSSHIRAMYNIRFKNDVNRPFSNKYQIPTDIDITLDVKQ